MSLVLSLPPRHRAEILVLARRWVGTPYQHQASVRNIGCDCIGLVRGIYRELYGHQPVVSLDYTRDWAEATGHEQLITTARAHLVEIDPATAKPADILVFRYRPHMIAKHAAILAASPHGTPTLIHATENAAIAEVPFSSWWRRRVAAAFAFPGIID